eukprot:jgi/Picsp_1/3138/NSC_05978-R1_protein
MGKVCDEDPWADVGEAKPSRVVRAVIPESSSSESESEGVEENEKTAGSERFVLKDAKPIYASVDIDNRIKLPSPGALLRDMSSTPEFLNPEAISELPTFKGSTVAEEISKRSETSARNQTNERDISRLAPKLQSDINDIQVGVVEQKAVSYRNRDMPQAHDVSVQIAMLGGVGPARVRGGSQKAMPVDKFIEGGVGGRQLPRKRQETKDKEKQKRMKGQSSHAEWKSEAEMMLRQQYD